MVQLNKLTPSYLDTGQNQDRMLACLNMKYYLTDFK